MTNRTQYVKLKNISSKHITTNTGAPQGSVLSPFLFTLYTNDCQIDNNNVKLIKFADDSTIQGLIQADNDETHYQNCITSFTEWCENHKLLLNVKKTKELIIDFRKKKLPLQPLQIKNEAVEQVSDYKYLGVSIDNKLDWRVHTSLLHSKVNKRMFFLRKLKLFKVDNSLLYLFYRSTIESMITFCLTSFGGNTRQQEREKIDRIIRKASKISTSSFHHFNDLYQTCCTRKINAIVSDSQHPLYSQIKISARSKRPVLMKCNKERYKKSFLPSAIKLLPSS